MSHSVFKMCHRVAGNSHFPCYSKSGWIPSPTAQTSSSETVCSLSLSSTACLHRNLDSIQDIRWVTGAWTHTGLTQNANVLVSKHFQKGDSQVSFHFLVRRTGFSYTVLHENEELQVHISLIATAVCSVVDKCVCKPVVYESGGYLVSPVNSILSYLARIHCSLKTLQMRSKTCTVRQKLPDTRARLIELRSSSRNPSIFHFYSHWLHFSLFLWQCPVSSLWLWDTNIPLWRHEPVTRSEEHEYPGKNTHIQSFSCGW